jgi:dTMP kinase
MNKIGKQINRHGEGVIATTAIQPKFITFEGGEGSGKSTQSKKLYEYLLSQNIKVIHTREVGGTPEAEKIRDLLVHSQLYPITELMLVMAARFEHINKVIVPALNNGSWVICDRFIDSTACYQSGSEITLEEIFSLHNKLMKVPGYKEAIMPSITFFMDLPPEIGLKRSYQTLEVNKFEAKDMKFHQRIYETFKVIGAMYPERIKSIDCAGKTEVEIHNQIKDISVK